MSVRSISAPELSAPRKLAALVPLALSSALFLAAALSRTFEFVTGTKRRSRVDLTPMGVHWTSTTVRGDTERSRVQTSIPWRRIDRSVVHSSFGGLGRPLGLIAFALGMWVGLATLADGLYVASPAVVCLGAGAVVAGIALDTLVRFVWPSRSRHVFELVLRDGLRVRLGPVDADLLHAFCKELEESLTQVRDAEAVKSQRGSEASHA